MDVYFTTCPDNDERRQMAKQALDWWKQWRVNLYLLTPQGLECDHRQFNRQRRIYADHHSDSYVYIVADDDCIPTTDDWDKTEVSMVSTMYRNRDFAVLSFWPSNANIGRWNPEDYQVSENMDVAEHVSVGGIRVCRQMFIKDWPPMTGVGYDLEHADMLRGLGYRVGYLQHHRMIHHGEGKSQLWKSAQMFPIAVER